jgi:hypothetical protein
MRCHGGPGKQVAMSGLQTISLIVLSDVVLELVAIGLGELLMQG